MVCAGRSGILLRFFFFSVVTLYHLFPCALRNFCTPYWQLSWNFIYLNELWVQQYYLKHCKCRKGHLTRLNQSLFYSHQPLLDSTHTGDGNVNGNSRRMFPQPRYRQKLQPNDKAELPNLPTLNHKPSFRAQWHNDYKRTGTKYCIKCYNLPFL
jgi:hypothetical protein